MVWLITGAKRDARKESFKKKSGGESVKVWSCYSRAIKCLIEIKKERLNA